MKRLALMLGAGVAVVATAQGPRPEPESAAHVDRVAAVQSASTPTPLRWDNVERSPLWLSGVQPRRGKGGLHRVELRHGASVAVRLPAGAWLRLHDPERAMCPQEFDVVIGDGSGLYAEHEAIPGDTRHNLFYEDRTHAERVAVITRVGHCGDRAETRSLAIFVSRLDRLGKLSPYRDQFSLPARAVTVETLTRDDRHSMYVLEPRRPVQFEIEGPTRLAVQTRIAFPQPEDEDASVPVWFGKGRVARNIDEYSLTFTLAEPSLGPARCEAALGATPAGQAYDTMVKAAQCHSRRHVWRRFDFDTSPEYSEPVKIDGCLTPTGRLETRYVDVPEGRHRFLLNASTPLLLRIRGIPRDDYLVATGNRIAPAAADVSAATGLAIEPVDKALIERLESAHASWQDNSRAEGALMALNSLLAVPEQSYMAEELNRDGRRLWRRHSYYREILPYAGGDQDRAAYAWYLPTRLIPFYEYGKQVHTAATFRHADAMGMNAAHFVPWARPCGKAPASDRPAGFDATMAALEYRLPERFTESRVRVLLDLPAAIEAQTLWVQYDDQQPIKLVASRELAGPLDERLPLPAEAGLQMLAQRVGGVDDPGFWGQLAASHPAAAILRPLTVEVGLPVEARRVRIWVRGCPSDGTRVALQYRTSKPFQLSESDYPLTLEALPLALRLPLFLSMLEARDESGARLSNWWIVAGEFADHESASDLARTLRLSGHDTVERLEVSAANGRAFQVLLGPHASKADALRAERKLRKISGRVIDLPQTPEVSVRRWHELARAQNSDLALLGQHWLPLLRMLRDRADRYMAEVQPLQRDRRNTLSRAEEASLMASARRHVEGESWLAALESWSELRNAGRSEATRLTGLEGQITALARLGELELLQQMLRGTAMQDRDPDLRRRAHAELLRRYRDAGQDSLVEGLLTASMLVEPDQAYYHGWLLVQHLLDVGEPHFAITFGLLLPHCYRPVEALVSAAYQNRWWQLFESLHVELPDAQSKNFWRGMRRIAAGDRDGARSAWREAGERGADWASALNSGEMIAQRLRASSRADRLKAVDLWGTWHSRHPGPHHWRYAPEIVHGHAELQSLESFTRGLYVPAFRSVGRKPVRLAVYGPARLRLEIRPVHADREPYDGWIHIEHNGRARALPYGHNRTIAGFERLDADRDEIGRAEYAVLDLGAGPHDIRISGGDRELLVRPHLWSPSMPLPVLPQPSVETVAAIAEAGLPRASDVGRARLPRLGVATFLEPRDSVRETRSCSVDALPDMAPTPLFLSSAAPNRPAGQACTVPPPLPAALSLLPARPPFVDEGVDAVLTAAPPRSKSERLSRLIALDWWNGQAPKRRAEIVAQAEALYAGDPDVPGARSVIERLRQWSGWRTVDAADRSGGVYNLDFENWSPESPYMRARRAVMQTQLEKAAVLYGNEAVAIRFVSTERSRVTVDLELLELPFAIPAPLSLDISVDGDVRQSVSLTRRKTRVAPSLSLDAGDHVLEVRTTGVYANQFVAVRLSETIDGESRTIAPALTRQYHVATRSEPVEVRFAEPRWVRIDRLRDDGLLSEERLLAAGEVLSIRPPAGREQEVVRVHRREPFSAAEGARQRGVVRMARTRLVAPTAPRRAYDHCRHGCRDHVLQVRDTYALGGQEDGTWGYVASGVNRRPVAEDVRNGVDGDRYLELALSHRYHNQRRQTYRVIEGLARVRDPGDPTLGYRYWFDWEPRHRPYSVEVFSSGYLQQLAEPGGDSGLEHAFTFRLDGQYHWSFGTRWRNTAEVAYFIRSLSLDRSGAAAISDRIDEDVFTRYKEQHQYGCLLWDRLTYTPWRDTALYGRVAMGCNEGFDADYADLHVGWEQLFGALSLELDHRLRGYFEDDDRAQSYERATSHLGLSWDIWPRPRSRWFVALDIYHEDDSGDLSGQLSIGLNRNNGRGYLDFRPGELPFRRLRQQHWAGEWPNNWLGEDERDF